MTKHPNGRASRWARAGLAAIVGLSAAVPLAGVPTAQAAPTITTGGPFTYTEQAPPLNVGAGTTVSGGNFYDGKYIEFDIGGATADESLALSPSVSPSVADGVVSVVGTAVYIGDGASAIPIGSIDASFDGQAGSKLRVNFGSDFRNAGFETGAVSPWTAVEQMVELGVTSIAGFQAVDTATYPANSGGDNDVPNSSSYSVAVTSAAGVAPTEGTYALGLTSNMQTRNNCDVVHGPAAYSSAFDAVAGQTLSFDWRAFSGSDAYAVFGYLLNTATGAQTEVLDAYTTNANGTTNWAPVNVSVPATGTYRFVFVSGTYDATCGRAAGASLYVDNFQVVSADLVDDAIVGKVANLLTYENTSDDPDTTRTINVLAEDVTSATDTGTITVNITPVNDPPVGTRVSEEWENTTADDIFADLTGTLSFTDPDSSSLTYGIVGGTAGIYSIGGTDYDSQAIGTYGTLYVDAETGAYRLVADDAAVEAVVVDPESEDFTVTAFDGSDTGSTTLTLGVQLPPAPRNVTGVPGNGQVTVSWDQPVDATGVTGYTVSASPGGATCATASAAATSCVVTGLTNGTPHTFIVTTSVGTPSLTSAPVTPVGPPTAPLNPSATPGDGRALIQWDPPQNDGGSPITGYTVTGSPGGVGCTTNGATNCTILGLAVGTTYTFTVTATTGLGTGPASVPTQASIRNATSTSIALSDDDIDLGQSVDLTATVTGSSPTGSVEFFADGSSIGSAAISGGVATLTATPPNFGSFTLTAVYSGDGGNSPSTSSGAALNVKAIAAATLSTSDSSPADGDEITLTATITGNIPTGTVEFFDGTTSLGTAPLTGGQAQLMTDQLGIGLHWLRVEYPGDAANTAATSSLVPITVRTVAGATLTTSDSTPIVGDEITLTATITGDTPTGTVEFFDGTTSLGSVPIAGGQAQLAIDTLAAGVHSINAVYSGDTENTGATTEPVGVTVRTIADAVVTASDDNPVVGDEITLTATVTGNGPTGTVEFFDGPTSLGTAPLAGGEATITTSALPTGARSVTAQYGGDSLNTADVSDPTTITVRTVAGSTLTASDSNPIVGDEITLTATITGDTPTGTVEFFDGTTSLGSVPVSGGQAQLAIATLTAGVHSINAVYSGDAENTPATSGSTTVTVRSTAGTSIVVDDDTPVLGDEVTLTATVVGNDPTGTVEFFDGVTSLGTAVLDNGVGSISTSALPAGVRSVTAQYGGDSLNTADVSDPVEIMVRTEASVSVAASSTSPFVGDAVTLTATITGNAPTGTVEFFDGTTSLGTAPVSAGSAVLSVPSFSAGAHSITAVYAGDPANVGATSSGVQVTAKKTVATAATVLAPNEPLIGGSVTVTVTVTGRTPTGTVEVFVNGTSVGTANVVAGKATLQVPASTAGAMPVRAVYSGDARNSGATAPTTSVTVAKHDSSISLAARATAGSSTTGSVRVKVGSDVTLTATVEGRSPTGTVEFFVADTAQFSGLLQFIGEGGNSLGSAPLVDGVATLVVDSLPIGVNSVKAEYSGDAQNLPDTSLLAEVRVYDEPKPATPEPKPTTGGPVPVTGTGYEPGTTVDLWLDEEGGVLLGTVTVGDDGSFSSQVTLPTTALGNHSIVVSGTDALGTEAVGTVPVEVTGTLPSTGSSSTGAVAQLAMLLLVAGVVLVVATNRRNRKRVL